MKSDFESYEQIATLLKKLPEEPLPADFDKRFWSRFDVEKNLPLEITQPWYATALRPVLGLTGILAMGLAGLLFFGPRDTPLVDLVRGEVGVTRKDSALEPLKTTNALKEGQTIHTGDSTWMILRFKNEYTIKIHPNSTLMIKKIKPAYSPGKSIFQIMQGEALVNIPGGTDGRYNLHMMTPNAFAIAKGTAFSVSSSTMNGKLTSHIRVLEGAVEAGSTSLSTQKMMKSHSVSPGYEASIEGHSGNVTISKMIDKTRTELEEHFQFGRPNQCILLISMGPDRVEELLRPCAIYIRYTIKDAQSAKVVNIVRSIQNASNLVSSEAHRSAVADLEKAVETEKNLDPVSLRLFVGAYYAYLNDFENAVRIFKSTASLYPDSFYSSMALMAAARLDATHLNQKEDALKLLDTLLTQYPESYEANSAQKLQADLTSNSSSTHQA